MEVTVHPTDAVSVGIVTVKFPTWYTASGEVTALLMQCLIIYNVNVKKCETLLQVLLLKGRF
jgi:hypothetical protein